MVWCKGFHSVVHHYKFNWIASEMGVWDLNSWLYKHTGVICMPKPMSWKNGN